MWHPDRLYEVTSIDNEKSGNEVTNRWTTLTEISSPSEHPTVRCNGCNPSQKYMLNKLEYMHRDIKPENILIDRFKNVKIADFGIARRVTGNNIFEMEKFSAKGTLYYAAPQVINNEKYSVLCDVWSCGLVIYFMLTGKNLFENCTVKDKINSVKLHSSKCSTKFKLESWSRICRMFQKMAARNVKI